MRAQLSAQIIYALCCLQAEKETLRGRGKQELRGRCRGLFCSSRPFPHKLPPSGHPSGLIQRRAGSPLPTLLHCSGKGLKKTVGSEAIPILSLSFSTWNLPSHSSHAAKSNWRAHPPIPFFMGSKELLEEMALKPSPHLPFLCGFSTPPLVSSTANPIPGLLQLEKVRESGGLIQRITERDHRFSGGSVRTCLSKSQKSIFWASSLGFWLPVLPPPDLLPWKPNLPGDFDFAWEGWWCVRLLREQGFLRAWCWRGRGARRLGSIPGKAADSCGWSSNWCVGPKR